MGEEVKGKSCWEEDDDARDEKIKTFDSPCLTTKVILNGWFSTQTKMWFIGVERVLQFSLNGSVLNLATEIEFALKRKHAWELTEETYFEAPSRLT